MTPGLVLQIRPNNDNTEPGAGGLRVGFTVSRKVGNAVARNRAKRRLSAAVKLVMPEHAVGDNDFVVIGRAATVTRPFPDLVGDLETALKHLDAWRAEGEAA